MTESGAGEVTFDNSIGKEMSLEELESEKQTNFFVGLPVFHPM